MPISVRGQTIVLVPSVVSVGMIGTDVPRLCRGLANGYTTYLRKIVVKTTDAGTAGAGKGAPIPVLIPPPVWIFNLLRGFSQNDLLGIYAPIFITGLSNGLSLATAQAVTNTSHPSVGVGAGVPSIRPPPAFSDIKLGFTKAGMEGPNLVKFSRAIAYGIETSLRTFIVPIPIAGPPSPSGASGRGTGKLI